LELRKPAGALTARALAIKGGGTSLTNKKVMSKICLHITKTTAVALG
jgi:hypothetical protein